MFCYSFNHNNISKHSHWIDVLLEDDSIFRIVGQQTAASHTPTHRVKYDHIIQLLTQFKVIHAYKLCTRQQYSK